jgi:GGDEF domain-containing protein
LSISKIEAGKVKLKKDLVDIVSVVRQAFSAFEQRAQEKGLELKGTFDHERIDLYCDVDRMIEVFTNLIGNAMKFVEKGHIEVIIRDTGEEVECVVADTGIGISKEDLPKVFGKFQQFGRTDGPGEKGTGLGLAISKKIVEMHKGRMWVESEYKVGTEFHFTMPKYTTEMLFKEYVDTGIKEAMKNDVKMSIVVISLGGVNELKRSIPAEKMQVLLADMKKAIDGNLHQEGETVVKDSGEIIVLLAGYDKEGAVRIEKRLQGILQEHLARLDLAGAITTHFGCATYPDEAENDEDLINRAKGEPQG